MTTYTDSYDSRPWLKNCAPGAASDLADIPFRNIPDMLARSVARFRSQPAFTTCLPNGMSGTLTYEQVDTLSSNFAAFLRHELGLAKGDRVALQMPNCLAYPVALFGVLKAGLVLVNVNPLYTTAEMEHQLNDSQTKALVIIDLFGDKLAPVIPKTQIRHVISVSVADLFPLPLKTLIKIKLKLGKKIPKCGIQTLPFSATLSMGAARASRNDPWLKGAQAGGPAATADEWVNLDDLAALQYTGGTTGVSKGAMLSHRNILANMLQITEIAKPKMSVGTEVILTALPLYHIFAFCVNCLYMFSVGAHNILIPSPRPMSNLRKAFEKYQVTWLTGVNTLFNALLMEPWFAQNPPKTLKAAVAGGTALQSAVAERWEKLLGTSIYEGYGLTESSPVLSIVPIGGVFKRDSIGAPVASTFIRCVDEQGESVKPGEPGELIAKGPQVMMGYWNRPDETAKTIKAGWLYTGDIGTMDDDGFFKIVDRKKDMILVSGFNVYPNEVEDAIMKHSDVAEVAVIGVPDGAAGECVRAFVVAKNPGLTAEDIRTHCKKYLTNYKVPKAVEFRKDLPKSPVGKILRKDLRTEVFGKS